MNKGVRFVVVAACLVLVSLLAYVLFAPGHGKKAESVDGTAVDTSTSSNPAPTVQTTEPVAPPVVINLPPATQPAITLGSATTQPAPIIPSTDSNISVAKTSGPTDWEKTLSGGTVTSGSSSTSSGFVPPTTLIGSTDTLSGGAASGLIGSTTRPSALSDSGSKTHKIAFGDTLSSIASEAYGNSSYYTRIIAANPGLNPSRLKVGAIIKIPDAAAFPSSPATLTPSLEKSPAAPGTTYTVKSGDSLQRIASHLYGSSDKWQKLYDLNKSTIGSDPHRLKVGMTLKLPDAIHSSTTPVGHY